MSKLVIDLPPKEFAVEEDDNNILLFEAPAEHFVLEHSLYAISKWESHFHKSYIKNKDKTPEENEYYIRCMVVEPFYEDPSEITNITMQRIITEADNYQRILNYINDPMTATYFQQNSEDSSSSDAITAELIYYWLIKLEIPVDIFEHWHINRLLTLIEVFNRKDSSSGNKKRPMSSSALARRRSMMEARRAQMGGKRG